MLNSCCSNSGWMCMFCSAQLLWPSNAVVVQNLGGCVRAGLRIQSGGVREGQVNATASRTDTQTSSCGPPLLRCCILTATSLRGLGRCPEAPTAMYPMSMPSKHTSQRQYPAFGLFRDLASIIQPLEFSNTACPGGKQSLAVRSLKS